MVYMMLIKCLCVTYYDVIWLLNNARLNCTPTVSRVLGQVSVSQLRGLDVNSQTCGQAIRVHNPCHLQPPSHSKTLSRTLNHPRSHLFRIVRLVKNYRVI